jgi:hypothetical protein
MKDLRKKSLEYDKTFKVCDRLAKDILEEIRLRFVFLHIEEPYLIITLPTAFTH